MFLPQALEIYTQSEFKDFFKIAALLQTWNSAADHHNNPDCSGMTYSKKDLPSLINLLGINYFDFNAQIESERLSTMVSVSPSSSKSQVL